VLYIGAGAAAGTIEGAAGTAGAVAGDATGQVVTSVNKGSSISNAVSNINTTNKVAAGTGMATESAIKAGQMQKEEKK
jgi:hypothetical protein